MCGIAGIHEFATGRPVDRTILGDMLDVIKHRGPDDDGMHVEGPIGLGMRRLSIIDLAGGKQPIASEDGRVVVVFNGEIYNYRELRRSLTSRGHRFSTASDTEVIVHLYEEKGDDCVLDLRGMFGFALWDAERRRLLLARDRLGIKPVYFTCNGKTLVFGSEIKALLQHPSVEAQLDPVALSHYLSLKYAPAPRTMFKGIEALPPGHTLVCDSHDAPRVRPYWFLSFAKPRTRMVSEGACEEKLDSLLRECVKSHLMSDVPFGAFLSGGVDSTTIVALMSQFMDKPVKTFSVGFDGDGAGHSELPFARLAAKMYGTEHEEVLVSPSDVTDLAEKVIWHLDQPVADNACVANYMVAQTASRQVKMVLTGEGGDELFAGYARYAGERYSPWFRMLPGPARRAALAVSRRLPGLRSQKLALFALCQPDELSRFTNWFPLFNEAMKPQLLSADYVHQVRDFPVGTVLARHLAETDAADSVSRMLYLDTKLWLADELLARGDKMSMAVSLEARVPLLDHKLVEFAASLPPNMKLRGFARKYLLKKVARKWLPGEIIDRKKQGFPMPFSIWFRKQARPFVRDLLSPDVIRRRGLLNPDYVETLLNEHESGLADHGNLVWGLLSLELWHRVFLDSPVRRVRRSHEAMPRSFQHQPYH